MTRKYLAGPKLGDFTHGIAFCKYIYDLTGEKADLYISNIGDVFERPLEFTYNELKPILEKQEWLNSFNIYNGENIDCGLFYFRNYEDLHKHNWLNVFLNIFAPGHQHPKEFKWIEMEKDEKYKNALLVNRTTNKVGGFPNDALEKYKEISSQFEEKYFICFDKFQYDNFPLKEEFKLLEVKNLYEFFKIINSGKLFMSNQTGPFAWASAMNVPRVLEILRDGGGIWYRDDRLYYKNFTII